MDDGNREGLGVSGASVLDHILGRAGVVGGGCGVDGQHRASIVGERRELDPMQHLSVGKEGFVAPRQGNDSKNGNAF